MAFDPSPIFDALLSKLLASGFVYGQISESKKPPEDRTVAVLFGGAGVTQVHGTTGSGQVDFILRFMYNAFAEPAAGVEKDIAKAVLEIMDDLAGNFNFGIDSVRNVIPLTNEATAGYVELGGVMYRIADLKVEVLVNDIVNFDSAETVAVAYDPACTLTAGIVGSAYTTFYTSTGDPIANFDIIQVDNELIVIALVVPASNALVLGRGYGGTTVASHDAGAAILKWGTL